MSRHEVYQRYLTKTLVVKIKEDKEMYMELRKEGKNAYCALSIIIKEPKVEEIISRYSYVFMEEVDLNTINEYIKNFLEDIEFRKNNSILKEGVEVENRTGTNTIKIPGYEFEFDLGKEFPILTTKQVFFKKKGKNRN